MMGDSCDRCQPTDVAPGCFECSGRELRLWRERRGELSPTPLWVRFSAFCHHFLALTASSPSPLRHSLGRQLSAIKQRSVPTPRRRSPSRTAVSAAVAASTVSPSDPPDQHSLCCPLPSSHRRLPLHHAPPPCSPPCTEHVRRDGRKDGVLSLSLHVVIPSSCPLLPLPLRPPALLPSRPPHSVPRPLRQAHALESHQPRSRCGAAAAVLLARQPRAQRRGTESVDSLPLAAAGAVRRERRPSATRPVDRCPRSRAASLLQPFLRPSLPSPFPGLRQLLLDDVADHVSQDLLVVIAAQQPRLESLQLHIHWEVERATPRPLLFWTPLTGLTTLRKLSVSHMVLQLDYATFRLLSSLPLTHLNIQCQVIAPTEAEEADEEARLPPVTKCWQWLRLFTLGPGPMMPPGAEKMLDAYRHSERTRPQPSPEAPQPGPQFLSAHCFS